MGEIVKNKTKVDLNDISERLKKLETETKCPIKQINGQRIFGPPNDWGAEIPPRGSEIFVGKLPRDMFEDQLYPLFSTCGTLYQIRLMLEFSGVNRGFAFVTYSSPEEAQAAVQKLNKYEIIPDHRILAFISIDNCRLFVANIPCNKTIKEIFHVFKNIMDGLEAVILSPHSKGMVNRGFVFLEFDSHKNALQVRKRFWPYNLLLWNRKLFIDWAIPHHVKAQCKQLLLKGLTMKITSEELGNIIYRRLGNVTLLGLKVRGTEAVVTFKTRNNATEAYQKLRGLSIDGRPLNIFYKYPEEELINDSNTGTSSSSTNQTYFNCSDNKERLLQLPQNRPSWVPVYPLQQSYPSSMYRCISAFQSKQCQPNYRVTVTPPRALHYPSTSRLAHFIPYPYPYQQPWYSNGARFFQQPPSPVGFWYPNGINRSIFALPSTNVSNYEGSKSKQENQFSITKVTEGIEKCLKIIPCSQNVPEDIEEDTDTEDEVFDVNSTYLLDK